MSEHNGKLVIFSAPSGAGKSTVNYLLPQFPRSVLYFSDPAFALQGGKRCDYYFLSSEEFKARVAGDELLEWEEVYAGTYYGTLRSEVERIGRKEKWLFLISM